MNDFPTSLRLACLHVLIPLLPNFKNLAESSVLSDAVEDGSAAKPWSPPIRKRPLSMYEQSEHFRSKSLPHIDTPRPKSVSLPSDARSPLGGTPGTQGAACLARAALCHILAQLTPSCPLCFLSISNVCLFASGVHLLVVLRIFYLK